MSLAKEGLQKTLLSESLVGFIVACSGPARGAPEDDGSEVVPIWPEAVSMLQALARPGSAPL